MSSRHTSRKVEVGEALSALEAWGSACSWIGPDPYEGLNASRLAGRLRRFRIGRRALIQAVRRSPVDLRPLFRIPPEPSAATLALVASAYARSNVLRDARLKLVRALSELEGLRTHAVPEPAWGYHFDVQTRFFFYPRTRPNTIATAFAGHALLDAFERTQDERYLREAEGVGEFFLRHVPQTSGPGGAYFGYLIGDRTPIHNASLLASAFLARAGSHARRDDFRAAAARGVGYARAHQLPNGGWPYAEPAASSWIDGYHTGYVLQALVVCRAHGLEVGDALERGLEHYWNALFLTDGTPRPSTTALYPVEGICAAEGIATFARAGHLERASKVFDYARSRLRAENGSFVSRRGRLFQERVAHPRWVEAPMLLALVFFFEALDS